MLKAGSVVWLKQAGKMVKAVVVDIDLDFMTLKIEYKQGQPINVKVKRNSNFMINGIDLEAILNNNKYMI